ncbi:MAG: PAS domain-containing protein [Phycisphaerales bacterium]|nr:PAS domain-containing protein [Phycisphaerales bacterium]
MSAQTTHLTGVERTFGEDEIIVSKTDTKGRVTYANEVFLRVAQYTEDEILGRPHNIIRHPDMPRCVFKVLWDTIQEGKEIFAYVINRSKTGDHYWVFAHVTPTFEAQGQITSYHSSRRRPQPRAVEKVKGVYQVLLNEERKHANPKDAIAASLPKLLGFLKDQRTTYEEFVFSL